MDPAELIMKEIGNKVDDAVVSVFQSKNTYVKLFNSRIDSVVSSVGDSVTVYLVKGKKSECVKIKDTRPESVRKAISSSIKALDMLTPMEYYNGIANGPFKYKKSLRFDSNIADESYSSEELAESAIGSALSNGASNVHGMLTFHYGKHRIVTTQNVDASEEETGIRCSIRAFTKNASSAHNYSVSRTINGVNLESLGKDVAETAAMAPAKGRIDNGTYDILYYPIPAGSLLAKVNGAACADSVEAGFSFLADKIGKQIANNNISIFDDGTIADGTMSGSFDGEGRPTQRTPIISNGVAKTYLHNTSTAVKFKQEPTANASVCGQIGENNMVFSHKKMKKSIEGAIGEMKKGIIVTNTWYTRFSNYLTGTYSTVPRDAAFYVQNGEIKHFISMGIKGSASVGIRLNDDYPRMLKNIEYGAGKTVQTSSWDETQVVYTPAILVEGVKVTTSSVT